MGMSVDTTDMQLIKEKTNSRCGHSRSIATGSKCKLTNRKVLLSVPSRYLETTISSCHDLCKHGEKLPFEEKVKFLTSKRAQCIPHGSNDLEKTADLEAGEKKSSITDVSEIPINGGNTCPSDERNASLQHSKEMEVSSFFARDHVATLVTDESTHCYQHFKEMEVSLNPASDLEVNSLTVNAASTPALGSPGDKKDFETRSAFPVMRSGSSRSKIGLRTPRIKSTRISTVARGKVRLPVTASVSLRTPRPKATRISTADRGKVLLHTTPAIALTHSVNGVSSRATRNLKHAKLGLNDKKCSIGKEKLDYANPESMPENEESRTLSDIKGGICGSDTSSLSEVKGQDSPIGRTNTPLTPSSSHKSLKSSQSVKVMKKLLPSPGSRNRKNSNSGRSSSNPSSAASSSGPLTTSSSGGTNETTSERGTSKKGNRVTGSGVVTKSRPRRAGIRNSEDRPRSSHKPQFRRGKVVDPKTETVTAPRGLKFGRTRTIGDTQQGISGAAGKGFKRTEARALEVKNNITEKVVLRHRNLERAKNVRCLFNNVIEETASKLVESRKSRVKALVGAFETVISLQDSKPRVRITAQ